MGYQQYATVDLTEFNYRFTMKEDGSGFDVEPADDFEMIINGYNPRTKEHQKGVRKLTLKASGDPYKQLVKRLGNEALAVVLLVPSDFEFSIETDEQILVHFCTEELLETEIGIRVDVAG